jgi:DNA polymerase beta
VQIVGSFRRGAATCGDVDVLVTHPEYTEEKHQRRQTDGRLVAIVDRLKALGYVVEQMGLGNFKFSGVCRLASASRTPNPNEPRKLDIKLFPIESFPFALMHFTGSGEFNRQMRVAALARSMTLSEFGICPVGETGVKGDLIPCSTEQDIFDLVGVPYKAPNERSL